MVEASAMSSTLVTQYPSRLSYPIRFSFRSMLLSIPNLYYVFSINSRHERSYSYNLWALHLSSISNYHVMFWISKRHTLVDFRALGHTMDADIRPREGESISILWSWRWLSPRGYVFRCSTLDRTFWYLLASLRQEFATRHPLVSHASLRLKNLNMSSDDDVQVAGEEVFVFGIRLQEAQPRRKYNDRIRLRSTSGGSMASRRQSSSSFSGHLPLKPSSRSDHDVQTTPTDGSRRKLRLSFRKW